MEVALIVSLSVAGVALLGLGIAGGLAYGFRNARDTAQEQIKYLREQIARLMPSPGPGGPMAQRGGVRMVEGGM